MGNADMEDLKDYVVKPEPCATGPWRTDEPPRDGTLILARFDNNLAITKWDHDEKEWDLFGFYGDYQTSLCFDPNEWANINP